MSEENPIVKTVVTARAGTGAGETQTEIRTAKTGGTTLILQFMEPWRIVGVRALRTFLTTMSGLITAKFTGLASLGTIGEFSPEQFLPFVWFAAQIAACAAFASAVLNSSELVAGWDITKPKLRG